MSIDGFCNHLHDRPGVEHACFSRFDRYVLENRFNLSPNRSRGNGKYLVHSLGVLGSYGGDGAGSENPQRGKCFEVSFYSRSSAAVRAGYRQRARNIFRGQSYVSPRGVPTDTSISLMQFTPHNRFVSSEFQDFPARFTGILVLWLLLSKLRRTSGSICSQGG